MMGWGPLAQSLGYLLPPVTTSGVCVCLTTEGAICANAAERLCSWGAGGYVKQEV